MEARLYRTLKNLFGRASFQGYLSTEPEAQAANRKGMSSQCGFIVDSALGFVMDFPMAATYIRNRSYEQNENIHVSPYMRVSLHSSPV